MPPRVRLTYNRSASPAPAGRRHQAHRPLSDGMGAPMCARPRSRLPCPPIPGPKGINPARPCASPLSGAAVAHCRAGSRGHPRQTPRDPRSMHQTLQRRTGPSNLRPLEPRKRAPTRPRGAGGAARCALCADIWVQRPSHESRRTSCREWVPLCGFALHERARMRPPADRFRLRRHTGELAR